MFDEKDFYQEIFLLSLKGNMIVLTIYWSLWRKVHFILKICMLNHSRILFEFFKRTLTRSTLLVLVAWFIYVILRRLNCFIHLVLIILRTEECEMSNFFVIFFIWVCVPSWSSFGKSKSCTTFKRIYDSSVWQNPLIILLCAIFECFFLLPLFLNCFAQSR